MSLQRAIPPLTSSTSMIFMFASSKTITPLRILQQTVRQFSSSGLIYASNKRQMQTNTWQTYTLSSPSPPPVHQADSLKTPPAGSIPQVHDTRPPTVDSKFGIAAKAQGAGASVTGAETHAAKPVKKRPRYNFVPLKQTIKFTPRAIEQLRELSNQPTAKFIKISVVTRGCSGSQYDLQHVEKPLASDIVQEQDGIKVLIDPAAQLKIIGSTMDYVTDRLSEKFVFDNPNIDKSCGCGESFMTKDESKAREVAGGF